MPGDRRGGLAGDPRGGLPGDPRLLSPQLDPRGLRPDSHGSSHSNGGEKPLQLPRDNRGDSRSVAEHINSEIERNLKAGVGGLLAEKKQQAVTSSCPSTSSTGSASSTTASLSSQHVINMSVERAIHNHNSASRLSKVIEDQVKKDAPPERTSIYATNRPNPPQEMEGLACPRSVRWWSDRQ